METALDRFLNKSKSLHGDKFDYSKVNYIDCKTPIIIICPIHGEFEQIPEVHYRKSQKSNNTGCRECGIACKTMTQLEFIAECLKSHTIKYDYSRVKYINGISKIKIICPIHGEFEQTAGCHMRGKNCPKCINGECISYTEALKLNRTKICTICGEEKCISLFGKLKAGEFGVSAQCRFCHTLKIKTKYKNDPKYAIVSRLRARLRASVKLKSDSTMNLLGCSIDDLMVHLQKTAVNNGYIDFDINTYSGREYHIDHIIPCASFDLLDPKEQKKCFHWTNLQILSAKANLIKNDNIYI